jgi:methylated-DNA-[protein]-cysteine S-methyltransferase
VDAFDDVVAELMEYFAGRRQRFELSLAPDGTLFQQRVWRALLD